MDKTTTIRVWLSQENFNKVQKGSYPSEILTTPPTKVQEYVEMTISAVTLTEWMTKHRSGTGKQILND